MFAFVAVWCWFSSQRKCILCLCNSITRSELLAFVLLYSTYNFLFRVSCYVWFGWSSSQGPYISPYSGSDASRASRPGMSCVSVLYGVFVCFRSFSCVFTPFRSRTFSSRWNDIESTLAEAKWTRSVQKKKQNNNKKRQKKVQGSNNKQFTF